MRAALAEIGIDLDLIVETYKYFKEMQLEDPELKIPTYRAKIPSGGGRAFYIVTGDDDFDTSVTSFQGVIASFYNCNAFFPNPEPGKEPPACSSEDGISGFDILTNEVKDCASCPNNQWGSKNGAKGSKRAKACKNMRRLYVLVEGSVVPIILTLPPTSINGWEVYKSAVLGVQKYSPKDVVTEFTLGTAANEVGTKYSVVQFKAVGVIGVKVRETVKFLSDGETYNKKISAEDYITTELDSEIATLPAAL